ncbi:MAG: MFS transporter [Chlamydiia bacterium]|nr:MFS transporter [Chlamydiia bacterium]
MKKLSLYGLFVWGIASIFFLYEFFLQVFLSTISSQVMTDFHLDASSFSMMNAGYFLPYALMQIPVGILVDRFGARRLLTIATAITATGVLWFSKVSSFDLGFTSRVFMGFGSSFAYVSLLILAMNWFPKKHFGLMVGIANLLGATGPFLAGGPLSYLLNLFHGKYRLILFFIALFGYLITLCVGFFVRNSPSKTKEGIIHLDPYKEKLSVRLKLLAQNRQAWMVVLFSGFVYVSLPLLGAYFGTSYLTARGMSQTLAATLSSFLWIGYALGGPLTGKLSDTIKRRKPLLIIPSLLGLIGSLLLLLIPSNHFMFLALLFFVIGFASAGCSVAFPTISEHVPPKAKATAMGFNNSIIIFFAALFPSIIGFLIELGAPESAHSYTSSQYEQGSS